MNHLDYCDALGAEITQFADVLATADFDDPVPGCPDWSVGDLAQHLGTVHRWAERLVANVAMTLFKNGIKRLRVGNPPARTDDLPFRVLSREGDGNGTELWLVRDWLPEMSASLVQAGAAVREVIDLDLEEGFVELLRSFRAPRREAPHV